MMDNRNGIILVMAAIGAAIITGVGGQCDASSRPLQLSADVFSKRWIHSPLDIHTGTHPSNASCAWRITAPPGYRVHLTVTRLDTEDGPGCPSHSLTVLYGYPKLDERAVRVCRDTEIEQAVHSEGRSLLVLFLSYLHQHMKGFSAQYTAVPSPRAVHTRLSLTARPASTEVQSTKACIRPCSHSQATAVAGGSILGGFLVLILLLFLAQRYLSRRFRQQNPSTSTPRRDPSLPQDVSTFVVPLGYGHAGREFRGPVTALRVALPSYDDIADQSGSGISTDSPPSYESLSMPDSAVRFSDPRGPAMLAMTPPPYTESADSSVPQIESVKL